jgi:hypothetical protein
MKAKLLLSLVLTFVVSSVAQEAPQNPKPKSEAAKPDQTTGTPAAQPQPGDPFVRSSATPRTPKPTGPPINVYGLLEYIEVPRDAWLAYSVSKPIAPDATALRAEVQSWIKAGKAKPIELTCVPTKPSQRVIVESIIERRYPVEYLQVAPAPVPSTFETRNTGLTLEWEPTVAPDQKALGSSLSAYIVRMAGNLSNIVAERKITQPGHGGWPHFFTHRATTSMSSQPNQWVLLDVIMPVDKTGSLRDEVRWLIFFRCAAVSPPNLEKGAPQPASEPLQKNSPQLMFEVERLAVSLADLNAWFAAKDLVAGTSGLREAAFEWIKAGRGREFDRRCVPTKSGERHVWESIAEINYPTSYKNDPVVAPAAFETRNTGYTVELEPTLGADGQTIDLSMVPQDVGYRSAILFPEAKLNGNQTPAIEQPVFFTMKITTSIFTTLGQPSLFAITTPSDETGEPDPKSRILTFVTFRK